MAFLRSFTRCNQSFAVSRKFTTSIRSGAQRRNHAITTLGSGNSSRAELLACQKYYVDLTRELNTSKNDEQQRSPMSTLAATKTAPTSAASASSNEPKPQRDPLDVSFNDPIAAFKSKTTWELIRAYFVYLMCSSEYLVENNMKVIELKLNSICYIDRYGIYFLLISPCWMPALFVFYLPKMKNACYLHNAYTMDICACRNNSTVT